MADSCLIERCLRYCYDKADKIQNLPSISIYRRDAVSDIEAVMYDPVICLILQGSKVTFVGDQQLVLRPGDALLVSHDLPVMSRITSATAQKPYLALILSLDLSLVRSLKEQVRDAKIPSSIARSLSAESADPTWLDPLIRYLQLVENPLDAKVLGPSLLLETHYRLVMSPIGGMLRKLISLDSPASRIAKAIARLRTEFRSPLAVSDLAKTAGMSPSSFHEHFKSVTGTTPLQYQKNLRLMEARALVTNRNHSVSSVAFAVGYESTTHFSRDYSRKFGLPPSQDTGGLSSNE